MVVALVTDEYVVVVEEKWKKKEKTIVFSLYPYDPNDPSLDAW